jgi:hypothetical protein
MAAMRLIIRLISTPSKQYEDTSLSLRLIKIFFNFYAIQKQRVHGPMRKSGLVAKGYIVVSGFVGSTNEKAGLSIVL